MAAAGAAARDVVALLLQHSQQWGVQLADADAAGDGAVVYAARGGDAEVLQMLAAAGLPLTARWPGAAGADRQQITALSCPATQQSSRAAFSQSVVEPPAQTAATTAMQRLQICSADVNADPGRRQPQPVNVQGQSTTSSCLQMPANVLPGMCLDGGDALIYVAAGAGSVGVVAWLLQKGIGEQSCKCCT
jgi:hypothetical protein